MSRFYSLFLRSRETLLFDRSKVSKINGYLNFLEEKKQLCVSGCASADQNINNLQDLKSIGHIRALPNVSLLQKLLALIFDRLNLNIWYRILPLDNNKCDDFAFSVEQSWDLIQLLLLHLGYILEIGEQTKLNVDKLRNLEHANMEKHKFHL